MVLYCSVIKPTQIATAEAMLSRLAPFYFDPEPCIRKNVHARQSAKRDTQCRTGVRKSQSNTIPVAIVTQALFVQAFRIRTLLWLQAVFQNLHEGHGMAANIPRKNFATITEQITSLNGHKRRITVLQHLAHHQYQRLFRTCRAERHAMKTKFSRHQYSLWFIQHLFLPLLD